MVRTILTHVAALATLTLTIILAVDLEAIFNSLSRTIIIVGAIIITIATALWDIRIAHHIAPARFKGKRRNAKVREYMTNLLKHDGRCVMSSNDLSWVDGHARDALIEKARAGSLVLVMPRPIKLSQELEKKGATAFYYGKNDFKFRSRFTLVNESRADSWIAIGYGTKGSHTIREIYSSSDPAFHLAEDLIELAKRVANETPVSRKNEA